MTTQLITSKHTIAMGRILTIGYLVVVLTYSSSYAAESPTDDASTLEQARTLGEQKDFVKMDRLLATIKASALSDDQYSLYHGLRLWSKLELGQRDAAMDLAVQELMAGHRPRARSTSIMFIGQVLKTASADPKVAVLVPLLHDLAKRSNSVGEYVSLSLQLVRVHVLANQASEAQATLTDIRNAAGETSAVVKFLKNNIWDELQRAGKRKEAYTWMQESRAIIKELNNDPDFLVNCGMIAYEAGRYEDALVDLATVVQQHPEAKPLLARAYWAMAISADALGQYEMAQVYLDEVLRYVEQYTGDVDFPGQVKLRRSSIRAKALAAALGPHALDLDADIQRSIVGLEKLGPESQAAISKAQTVVSKEDADHRSSQMPVVAEQVQKSWWSNRGPVTAGFSIAAMVVAGTIVIVTVHRRRQAHLN